MGIDDLIDDKKTEVNGKDVEYTPTEEQWQSLFEAYSGAPTIILLKENKDASELDKDLVEYFLSIVEDAIDEKESDPNFPEVKMKRLKHEKEELSQMATKAN